MSTRPSESRSPPRQECRQQQGQVTKMAKHIRKTATVKLKPAFKPYHLHKESLKRWWRRQRSRALLAEREIEIEDNTQSNTWFDLRLSNSIENAKFNEKIRAAISRIKVSTDPPEDDVFTFRD